MRRKGVRGKIRGVYGCAFTGNMQHSLIGIGNCSSWSIQQEVSAMFL